MRKIFKVAQREYVETVKTKTFIIGVLMAPLIIVGIIFFTSRAGRGETAPRPAFRAEVTDLSNELLEEITASFEKYNSSKPNRQIRLELAKQNQSDANEFETEQKDRLRQGQLNIYIVLENDIVQGQGKMRFYTYKMKPSELDILWTIENLCNRAVQSRRYKLEDVSQELISRIRRPATMEHLEIGGTDSSEKVKEQSSRIVEMMMPFFFMYLMFFGIFVNGQQMLTSIIEEKSSRVIEVLLSALSPFELMTGKIIGLIGIGLTVVGLWGAAAYAGTQWRGINIDITGELMFYFMVYYVLGFALFSAILAGIGSVCNTLKEAQSLMMPVTFIFILPLLSWFRIVQNPEGTLSRVLSFFPPVTSMVMILRMVSSNYISKVEIFATLAVLAGSVLGVMWLSAKIFRTGILMYGKRPAFREIVHWLRQK